MTQAETMQIAQADGPASIAAPTAAPVLDASQPPSPSPETPFAADASLAPSTPSTTTADSQIPDLGAIQPDPPLTLQDSTTGPFDPLFELLATGGPVMYILAFMSCVMVAVLLYKLLQFAQFRLWSHHATEQALTLWRDGQHKDAPQGLAESRNPVAMVLHTALQARLDPDMSAAEAREEAERVALMSLEHLQSGLRILALIATLSPLLGLLGTVIGMIDAFQALENAGSKVDPAVLSGGIWVALLTTAAGLVVAIPAAAAHQWLEAIVEGTGRRMENVATQAFTHQPTARFTALQSHADQYANKHAGQHPDRGLLQGAE